MNSGRAYIFRSIGWLVSGQLLRLVVTLIIAIYVARYLGPERFGALNYAISFVMLFSAIGRLGLEQVVIKNLVQRPTEAEILLGTGFIIRLIATLIMGMLIVACAALFDGAPGSLLLIMIITLSTVFQPVDLISFWFQSRTHAKLIVFAATAALLAAAAARFAFIRMGLDTDAFAWAIFLEAALSGTFIVLAYQSVGGRLLRWRVDLSEVKYLLRASWPLAVSGVAIDLYMRVDQVMLENMQNTVAVGKYAAAARISEAGYFIAIAIITSVFPSIIRARKKSQMLYDSRMQWLYQGLVLVAYAIASLLSVTAWPVMSSLYGDDYVDGAPILLVHVWATGFVFIGAARGRWMVAEEMTMLSMAFALLGAIANIILNLLLIPSYSGIGAAWATLISYALSAWVTGFFFQKTRGSAIAQTRALIWPFGVLRKIRDSF